MQKPWGENELGHGAGGGGGGQLGTARMSE